MWSGRSWAVMTKNLMIRPNKRITIISAVFAVLFATSMIMGCNAARNGGIKAEDPVPWIAGLLSFVIALTVMNVYLRRTSANAGVMSKGPAGIRKRRAELLRNWAVMFVCWMPVFLAEYPGFFVYDAIDEYTAVATRHFTTHHPLLHTLALGGFVRAGEVFLGSANAGIAVFILAQMLLLSLMFAWVVSGLNRFRLFALLWYALFPTVVMFALCSVKDTSFAAAMTVAVILTVRVLEGSDSASDHICLAAALLLMMLLRHNAVYAYIIYACVMGGFLAATRSGEKFRRIMPALGLAALLVIYGCISAVLTYACRAEDHEHQEMLTVPIQQLARTWSVYADEFSSEELETLYAILPEDSLRHYTPELSDPVKIGFDNNAYELDPARYRRLWFELFKRHPLSYINAWLDTSYGYYYPYAVVNVYQGHQAFTFTYTDSSYFGYEVEYPGERHSLIPVIDRFYRWLSLDDDIQRIPVIARFFSMGAMFWVYAFGIAVFIYRRRWPQVIAFMLPLAVWATLLAGPTFLPRYTVFWWFMLPYLIYCIGALASDQDSTDNKEERALS